MRLRTMYRKSVEYRLAHSLFETKFRRLRIALAFIHLVSTCHRRQCEHVRAAQRPRRKPLSSDRCESPASHCLTPGDA